MKKWILFLMLFAAWLPLAAQENDVVRYAGGTVAQVQAGAAGKFDPADPAVLRFVFGGGNLAIPYSSIKAFEHTNEVAVHLGVAPAIAVGLLVRRRRNHFLRITFEDGDGVKQVVVFEVSKQLPAVLVPLLVARAPQASCGPFGECGPEYMARKQQVRTQAKVAP